VEAASSPAARPPRLLLGLPLAALVLFVGSLLGLAVVLGGTQGCAGGEALGSLSSKVPRRLVPIYMDAAERYRLGPRGPSVLAAINWVETGFGTDPGTSSAGAEGWMQFEPESWAEFGVDGDGDGVEDPDDPWDAIFAAARLLRSDGAPSEWSNAIWDYNHADWYVEQVLRYARRFSDGKEVQTSSACAAAAVPPNEAVGRMVAEAERLSILRPHTEYVWGGSHGQSPTPADGPFDCSSAVSHLLQVGGFGNPTMATPELARWGEPGPGRWVTIFVKPFGGEAHTFVRFSAEVTPAGERYWGTSGFVEPGHGPGWIPESTFSEGYLAGFLQRHPPGL
jgi:transglycosylase-like protein with SLT domain